MSRERGNQMAKKNEEVNEETLDKETEKTAEPKEAEKSNEEVLEEKLKEQTDKYMRGRNHCVRAAAVQHYIQQIAAYGPVVLQRLIRVLHIGMRRRLLTDRAAGYHAGYVGIDRQTRGHRFDLADGVVGHGRRALKRRAR